MLYWLSQGVTELIVNSTAGDAIGLADSKRKFNIGAFMSTQRDHNTL